MKQITCIDEDGLNPSYCEIFRCSGKQFYLQGAVVDSGNRYIVEDATQDNLFCRLKINRLRVIRNIGLCA